MAVLQAIVLLAAVGLVAFVAAYQGTIRALRDFHGDGDEPGSANDPGAGARADAEWVKRSDR